MVALSAPTMDFSGSPNAPVYAEDAAAAQDAYNQALTNTAAKQAQLYNQAGLKVTNNPDGSIASYSVDGLNPTGQYQQLEKSEGEQLEAQHEADMSRGIGTSGIAEQPTSNLRYANAVAQTNFGNNLINANDQLVDGNTNAFNTYQQTLLNLQLQAIADARALQSYPNETVPGSGGSGTNPAAPGGAASANPGSGSVNATMNMAYAATPVGQQMVQAIKAKPASAGSSGAAQTLLAAATKKNIKNYQAARDAV